MNFTTLYSIIQSVLGPNLWRVEDIEKVTMTYNFLSYQQMMIAGYCLWVIRRKKIWNELNHTIYVLFMIRSVLWKKSGCQAVPLRFFINFRVFAIKIPLCQWPLWWGCWPSPVSWSPLVLLPQTHKPVLGGAALGGGRWLARAPGHTTVAHCMIIQSTNTASDRCVREVGTIKVAGQRGFQPSNRKPCH